jgi:hypothetical protein
MQLSFVIISHQYGRKFTNVWETLRKLSVDTVTTVRKLYPLKYMYWYQCLWQKVRILHVYGIHLRKLSVLFHVPVYSMIVSIQILIATRLHVNCYKVWSVWSYPFKYWLLHDCMLLLQSLVSMIASIQILIATRLHVSVTKSGRSCRVKVCGQLKDCPYQLTRSLQP